RIYHTGEVIKRNGNAVTIHGHISMTEGRFLYDLIASDPTIKRTLEVGCAYGLTSLWICSALVERPGVIHTIVDPFQVSFWDAIGVTNLERADLHFFDFKEAGSEFVLP